MSVCLNCSHKWAFMSLLGFVLLSLWSGISTADLTKTSFFTMFLVIVEMSHSCDWLTGKNKCHISVNVHLEAQTDTHNTEFSRLKVWSIAPFFRRSHVPLMSCCEKMCWNTENNMMWTWERWTMHHISFTLSLTITPSAATLGTISLTPHEKKLICFI